MIYSFWPESICIMYMHGKADFFFRQANLQAIVVNLSVFNCIQINNFNEPEDIVIKKRRIRNTCTSPDKLISNDIRKLCIYFFKLYSYRRDLLAVCMYGWSFPLVASFLSYIISASLIFNDTGLKSGNLIYWCFMRSVKGSLKGQLKRKMKRKVLLKHHWFSSWMYIQNV